MLTDAEFRELMLRSSTLTADVAAGAMLMLLCGVFNPWPLLDLIGAMATRNMADRREF